MGMKLHMIIIVGLLGGISADELEKAAIVGGQEIGITDAPYQVQLHLKGPDGEESSYCGGSIIGVNHVLTAAHCVKRISNMSDLTVTSGSSVFGEGRIHRVKHIIAHENYTYNAHGLDGHDIAVVVVKDKFKNYALTSSIGLAYFNLPPGEIVFVSGWGETLTGLAAKNLRGAHMAIANQTKCADFYKETLIHPESTICTEGESFPCYGDSGGPLVFHGILVGVVMGRIPNCNPKGPTVFTSVAYFVEWIQSVKREYPWEESGENNSPSKK